MKPRQKEIAIKRSQILREQGLRARKHITLDEIGRRLALGNFKELNLIIKRRCRWLCRSAKRFITKIIYRRNYSKRSAQSSGPNF